MHTFKEFSQKYTERINKTLENRFKDRQGLSDTEPHLEEAMQYCLFNGGKRIRPLLVYASAETITDSNQLTDTAAAAIECIHTYSLIHDDLPAMDDDNLRRGKPTCHIAYNEATAILAGDGLQALAFDWLSQAHGLEADQLYMCNLLAKASGTTGMVAGQAIDLAAVNQQLSLEQLSTMHRLKTGALINASVALGAHSTGVATPSQLEALNKYANAIGLAFQVQDDILDVTSDTTTLGKRQGADAAQNKPTFVSLLGLDEAGKKVTNLYDVALNSLSCFDYRADNLRHLAGYIVKRNH